MNFLKNRHKALFYSQLALGIIGIVLVIIAWINDYNSHMMLAAGIILAMITVLLGIERFVLNGSKGILIFSIVVGILIALLFIVRYYLVMTL